MRDAQEPWEAYRMHKEQLANSFVEKIRSALEQQRSEGAEPPLLRRKLLTIVHQCGYENVVQSFLDDLQQLLKENGLYTEPPLNDPPLDRDDFVYFSTGPFPPDRLFFPTERQLQDFVKNCLGAGPFRGYRLYDDGERAGDEFRVPGGRIDLLCESDCRHGKRSLVAIELKRGESAREAVVQVVGYLRALQQMFPDRHVRGMIISGREDLVGLSVLSEFREFEIDWYCYKVEFKKVTAKHPSV